MRARALVAGLVAAAVTLAVFTLLEEDDEPTRTISAAAPGAATDGRAVFARMGCGNCHRLAAASSTGRIGPDLDERLAAHTGESLKAVILDPPTGAMPENFGERMSSTELDALVAFLLASR